MNAAISFSLEPWARESATAQRTVLKWAFGCVSVGLAPGVVELASLCHALEDEVWVSMRELVAAGLLQTDRQGSIVGALGLSLVPTQHHLAAFNRILYGWCAEDAVGIAAALRWDARVSSICGQCRWPITAEMQSGQIYGVRPPGVRLWLDDAVKNEPVSIRTCSRNKVFCRSEHVSAWLEEHPEVAGKQVDLEQATEMGGEI